MTVPPAKMDQTTDGSDRVWYMARTGCVWHEGVYVQHLSTISCSQRFTPEA